MPFWEKYIKNFYFVLGSVFLIWMFLFDGNDFVTQYQQREKLHALEEQKEYYIQEIKQIQEEIEELRTDEAQLEKFAREKYLMKKDNEDVYVIIRDTLK